MVALLQAGDRVIDHPDHEIAKAQMKGYTGMLSFELIESVDSEAFMRALKMIKQSMSLAGVESTILSPAKTSHALLSPEERKRQGKAFTPRGANLPKFTTRGRPPTAAAR